MRVQHFNSGKWKVNSYLIIKESNECYVIDPAFAAQEISHYIKENKLTIRNILLTHGHFDHIESVHDLQSEFKLKVVLHKKDSRLVKQANLYQKIFGGERVIKTPDVTPVEYEDEKVEIDNLDLRWIHTPGHTKGSSCLMIEQMLFTGDTFFKNAVGRTDLPGGNKSALIESIEKILLLNPKLTIYPGHGKPTQLKDELNYLREYLNESCN